jgi:hypothetical protein
LQRDVAIDYYYLAEVHQKLGMTAEREADSWHYTTASLRNHLIDICQLRIRYLLFLS